MGVEEFGCIVFGIEETEVLYDAGLVTVKDDGDVEANVGTLTK
jgi:hypothetical protein